MINQKPFFIGGDHSISYPLVKNFIESHENSGIIVLDAHPDLVPPTQNPTHEEWLAAIIKETQIKPENILLIGARNIDPSEKGYQIKTIAISELPNCSEKIKEFSHNKNIYLSIDIDFFDSSIAPATGYPEKNGSTKQQGLDLIKDIIQTKRVRAIDLVEVNPTKHEAEKTICLARDIIKTFEEANW
ncbi:MAG: arginase family protein [Candidatus Omnitrophica bacterium]|nr:arginase family protein [Candidatus Omnitrophota bacterium]